MLTGFKMEDKNEIKLIKSVSDIKQDSLKLCFVDGFVYTKVEKIKKENING